jgi:hypothetical protein
MMFVQQPTDTPTGQPFIPPISVQISDFGNDILNISVYTGTCNIVPHTVTAVDGFAEFTGFTAGITVGTGCRLIVRNLSRPEVPDIISDPFDTLPPVGPTWEVVAVTEVSGTFGTSTIPFNADGGNVIVVFFNANNGDSSAPFSASDNQGNVYTTLAGAFTPFSVPQFNALVAIPAITGPNQVLNWNWFSTFVVFRFIVLRASGIPQLLFSGFNVNLNGFTVTSPPFTAVPDSIAVLGYASIFGPVAPAIPAGYTPLGSEASAMSAAYQIFDTTTAQQPAWTSANLSAHATGSILIEST